MFIKKNYWLILILATGLFIRCYKINLPLLDAKPHREIHTAEITRNLYWDSFNVFYTKTKIWGDEPGYYPLEFPLYNIISVLPYFIFGEVNEIWGKLISIASSVGMAIFFYLLVQKIFGKIVAIWSLIFVYLFSPQEIMLSRSFQPDQFGLFFGISSIYYFLLWIKNNKVKFFFFSFILFSMTLLTKIQFFPFGFPIIYLALHKWKIRVFNNRLLLVYGLSIVPAIFWFIHVRSVYLQYPNLNGAYMLTISSWFNPDNYLNLSRTLSIIYDFSVQVITVPVFILSLIGLLLLQRKNYGFIYAWFAGLILFVGIYNVHIYFWYYQVSLIFPFAILAGKTITIIYSKFNKNLIEPRYIVIILVLFIMVLTARPYVLRTYKIDSRHNYVLETAQKVKETAPLNGKIIASSYNSAALTYYSLRKDLWGATFVINDPGCTGKCSIDSFEKLKEWGASVYAVSDKNELFLNPIFYDYLKSNYKPIKETDNYVIYSLNSQIINV